MSDAMLDEEIKNAFEWLAARAPSSADVNDRLNLDREAPRGRTSPVRTAVLLAGAVLLVIGVPLLNRAARSGTDTTGPKPREFVTSIPDGEILLVTGPDWELYGFVTPEGIPCLRGSPFTDASYCASPELWAIPGIFSWQGTWGTSSEAWVYGYIRDDVEVEFQFHHEGVPDPADPGFLFTAGPHPDLGWAVYVLKFNPDTHGLFTVVTAYDSEGLVLGNFDLRDECEVVSSETLERDQRLRELCSP